MNEFTLSELKAWREKMGLSQQRFATIAKVSLLTVRQLETGLHSPRKATLAKIIEAVKAVEANPELAVHRRRRRRAAAEEAPGMEGAPALEAAPVAEGMAAAVVVPVAEGMAAPAEAPALPKRRGRPPKALVEGEAAVPKRRGRAAYDAEGGAPARAAAPSPYIFTPDESRPIKLSNLDLELISRILNMTGREKLDLLLKLD